MPKFIIVNTPSGKMALALDRIEAIYADAQSTQDAPRTRVSMASGDSIIVKGEFANALLERIEGMQG